MYLCSPSQTSPFFGITDEFEEGQDSTFERSWCLAPHISMLLKTGLWKYLVPPKREALLEKNRSRHAAGQGVASYWCECKPQQNRMRAGGKCGDQPVQLEHFLAWKGAGSLWKGKLYPPCCSVEEQQGPGVQMCWAACCRFLGQALLLVLYRKEFGLFLMCINTTVSRLHRNGSPLSGEVSCVK